MSLQKLVAQPHMQTKDMQMANEYRFAKAHIDGYVRTFLREDTEVMALVDAGVLLVQAFLGQDYYKSKNERLAQIQHLDLETLVFEIFVASAYCQVPEMFTSVTAKMAGHLHFDDKEDSIKTIAELMAVLAETDIYDIIKENKFASLKIQSNIQLSDQLLNYVENSSYLPPLVHKPKSLTRNRQSAYLTVGADSVILGKGNHHEGDVCLDVLNICNHVALRMDTDFLSTVEETPNHTMETQQQQEEWDKQKIQSYEHYLLISKQGNKFYLSHKVDKRGRIYCQGYHITTQGSPFKKAAVELYSQQMVSGVPEQFRS